MPNLWFGASRSRSQSRDAPIAAGDPGRVSPSAQHRQAEELSRVTPRRRVLPTLSARLVAARHRVLPRLSARRTTAEQAALGERGRRTPAESRLAALVQVLKVRVRHPRAARQKQLTHLPATLAGKPHRAAIPLSVGVVQQAARRRQAEALAAPPPVATARPLQAEPLAVRRWVVCRSAARVPTEVLAPQSLERTHSSKFGRTTLTASMLRSGSS